MPIVVEFYRWRDDEERVRRGPYPLVQFEIDSLWSIDDGGQGVLVAKLADGEWVIEGVEGTFAGVLFR